MNKEKFDLFYFFAKTCGIDTLGELQEYKRVAKCKNNDELLDNLYRTATLLCSDADYYLGEII